MIYSLGTAHGTDPGVTGIPGDMLLYYGCTSPGLVLVGYSGYSSQELLDYEPVLLPYPPYPGPVVLQEVMPGGVPGI